MPHANKDDLAPPSSRAILLSRACRHITQHSNLLDRHEPTRIEPRTGPTGALPVARRSEILRPERKRPTLRGPIGVDAAGRPAVSPTAIQEDAVKAELRSTLSQRRSSMDQSGESCAKFGDRQLQTARQAIDLVVIDPDKPGRSGTAIATLGAGKAQTVAIPLSLAPGSRHLA